MRRNATDKNLKNVKIVGIINIKIDVLDKGNGNVKKVMV